MLDEPTPTHNQALSPDPSPFADDPVDQAKTETRGDLSGEALKEAQDRAERIDALNAEGSAPPPAATVDPLPVSRRIRDHEINACNAAIEVLAIDAPGPGGANHVYRIRLPDWYAEPLTEEQIRDGWNAASKNLTVLQFQNGPVKETKEGINGITHEVLIAVVLDRLRAFQAGPYACTENQMAIEKLQEAMAWLHTRTANRDTRGVEGTMQV